MPMNRPVAPWADHSRSLVLTRLVVSMSRDVTILISVVFTIWHWLPACVCVPPIRDATRGGSSG